VEISAELNPLFPSNALLRCGARLGELERFIADQG
jgi:hypothetical protein